MLSQSIVRRFEKHFQKTEGCWEWQSSLNSKGYGQFGLYGSSVGAHTVSYFIYVEPVWSSVERGIDHLCRNKKCVNPAHLRLLDNHLNALASPLYNANKTHCPAGHEYTSKNTYYERDRINRHCKRCKILREKGVIDSGSSKDR